MGRPITVLVLLALAWWWLTAGPSAQHVADEPPRVIGRKGLMPGRFYKPRAVAVGATGDFYVADKSGRIQYFDAELNFVLEWELPEFEKGQPVGLAVDADSTLLVNDSHYSRILRYSPRGEKLLAKWGQFGTGPGEFRWGRDVVVDSGGNVYAGDYGEYVDRIHKFSPTGEFILQWGTRGTKPGEFGRPQGMALEHRGDKEFLLVADCGNHRIQRFTVDGEFVDAIGKLGQGPGEFTYPYAVDVDSRGNLYVCEWQNSRIQKLSADGEFLGVWGAAGSKVGELSTPWDLEIGPDDRIYVVDHGNHRVQVFHWQQATMTASGVIDLRAERQEIES